MRGVRIHTGDAKATEHVEDWVNAAVEATCGIARVRTPDIMMERGFLMSFHFIVRFEPRPGKEAVFREEVLRVVPPTRAEAGCISLHVYESLREPIQFAIHSEWADEAAFDLHAQMPHTVNFLEAAESLLAHAIHGLRSRQIT